MLPRISWRDNRVRKRVAAELKSFKKGKYPQALILMYHRVAPHNIDLWSTSVTPENFDQHLQIIKRYTNPISLRDLAIAQRSGKLPERAVAITFDDGYADNLYWAKPLLTKHGIPATVFVATGYTDSRREFWWDELEQILLQPGNLPSTLTITINGKEQFWDLGPAAYYSEQEYLNDHERSGWRRALPGSRLDLYYRLSNVLQTLDHMQQRVALNTMLDWSGKSLKLRRPYRQMTCAELHALEEGNLISIGAHTSNHPKLPEHSLDYQKEEVLSNKIYLETVLNHSIDTFAYPFGAYCSTTRKLLEDLGFIAACTVVEETVWAGNHTLELPRFKVNNWSKDQLKAHLRKWLKNGF